MPDVVSLDTAKTLNELILDYINVIESKIKYPNVYSNKKLIEKGNAIREMLSERENNR